MNDIQIFYSGPASTPNTIWLLDNRHNTVIEKMDIPGKTGQAIRRNFKKLRAVLNLKRDYIVACEQSDLDMKHRAEKDLERMKERTPLFYTFDLYNPYPAVREWVRSEERWFSDASRAENHASSITEYTVEFYEIMPALIGI